MQTADVTVRLQALEGTWEVCGRARYPQIVPESVSYTTNEWGPETCSFTLRRRPGDFHPDLASFTPCEIEIGGILVWSGRVRETPSKEGADQQITVSGQGAQFYLDDDLYQRVYVHTRLSEYQDMRAMPTAVLSASAGMAAGQVSNDQGAIQLGPPKGSSVVAGGYTGVVLDLGPNSSALAVEVDWESSNNATAWSLFARCSDYPDSNPATGWAAGHYQDAFVLAMTNGGAGSGTVRGTVSPGRRYVQLFSYNGVFTGATGNDEWFKIRGARVYTDTNYSGNGVSVLRASDIIPDAIAKAATALPVPSESPPSYQSEVLSTNAAAQVFPLDDTSGSTVVDLIDATRTNTISTPGVTLNQSGLLPDAPTDRSVGFSGVSTGYITMPLVVTTAANWTLEAVFKPVSMPQLEGFILYNGTGTTGYGFGIGGAAGGTGSKLIGLFQNVTWIDLGITLTAGVTYHVIFSRNLSGQVRCVVNGSLTYAASPTGPAAPTGASHIGSDVGGARNFTGNVAFAATYSRALGPGEEQKHYQAALSRGSGTMARTLFDFPEFRSGDSATPQTPREVITAVNALHDYQAKVAEDKTVIFRAKPSIPLLEVGAWSGAEFTDTSAGSADDTYTRCIVTGTAPDGVPIWIDNDGMSAAAGGQFSNPSFDVNTNDWTCFVGSIARDTGVFQSTPASLKLTGSVGGLVQTQTSVLAGVPLIEGRQYKLSFWYQIPNGVQLYTNSGLTSVRISNTAGRNISVTPWGYDPYNPSYGYTGDGVWHQYTVPFIYSAGLQIQFSLDAVANSAINGYIDTIQILERDPNLATTRRGVTRTKSLPMQAAINTTVATQIAQIFLNGHTTTPVKGSLKAVGSGGVRSVVGGGAVPAHALGTYAGELVRLSHIIDPDTGGLGRDGRIAAVAYTHADRTASMAVDNQRQNFETFLARLAVVTGVKTQT